MTDPNLAALRRLRRPKLLIRAARFGLAEYSRERDLRRVMQTAVAPPPGTALPRLIEVEARLEEIRQLGGAGYSPARHVEVLIALMAEARFASRAGAAA